MDKEQETKETLEERGSLNETQVKEGEDQQKEESQDLDKELEEDLPQDTNKTNDKVQNNSQPKEDHQEDTAQDTDTIEVSEDSSSKEESLGSKDSEKEKTLEEAIEDSGKEPDSKNESEELPDNLEKKPEDNLDTNKEVSDQNITDSKEKKEGKSDEKKEETPENKESTLDKKDDIQKDEDESLLDAISDDELWDTESSIDDLDLDIFEDNDEGSNDSSKKEEAVTLERDKGLDKDKKQTDTNLEEEKKDKLEEKQSVKTDDEDKDKEETKKIRLEFHLPPIKTLIFWGVVGIELLFIIVGFFTIYGLTAPYLKTSKHINDKAIVTKKLQPPIKKSSRAKNVKASISYPFDKNKTKLPSSAKVLGTAIISLQPFYIPVVYEGDVVFLKLHATLTVSDPSTKAILEHRLSLIRNIIYENLKGIVIDPNKRGNFLLKYCSPLKKALNKQLAPYKVTDITLMGFILR